ncbi:hypothetical protein [Symbiopectobacterium purcellii]|uniref:hypothetical protein n=1 Tax=Symbiopectobacterium purcellii TaxID=2871826 RepID=UPI003F8488F5
MIDFTLVLLSLTPVGFMLYASFDREIDRIRQKRAAARRKAYRARKEDIERQARRRL